MTDRIFIGTNQDELELTPGTTLAMNYQINDLGNLQDRQADFSQQFTLPLTRRNAELFESAGLIQSLTSIPYRKSACRVSRRGIDIVVDGVLILDEINNGYKVTVYSGNFSIVDLLGDKLMYELNFLSTFNLALNYDEFVIYFSRTFTAANGYIFGVANFHDNLSFMSNAAQTYWIDGNPPQMFVAYLWTQIFKDIGLTPTGPFLASATFQNLLLQLYCGSRTGVIFRANLTGALQYNFPDAPTISQGIQDNIRLTTVMDEYFQTGWAKTYAPDTASHLEMAVRGAERRIIADVTFDAFNNTASPVTFTFEIKASIQRTSNFHTIATRQFTIPAGGSFTSQTIRLESDCADWYVAVPGFTYEAFIHCAGLSVFNAGTNNMKVNVTACDVVMETTEAIHPAMAPFTNINKAIAWRWGMPDMTQYDFIKSIMQLFGLFIRTNPRTRQCEFRTLNDIYNNIPTAKDWTHKLDMTANKSTISFRENYGQKTWFRWAESDDNPDKFADGFIAVDDTTLPAEVDMVNLPFGASRSTPELSGLEQLYVPKVPMWTATGEWVDLAPRLLLLDRRVATAGNIKNQDTQYGPGYAMSDFLPLTKFVNPQAGAQNNLSFNNDVIAKYYNGLENILNRYKKFTGWFQLDDVDILNLDFFTPIYLQQFNAYFYINIIKNYTGNGLTAVELIRL